MNRDDDERERERRRQEAGAAEMESLELLMRYRPKPPKPRTVYETAAEAQADDSIAAAQSERFDVYADHWDAMAEASRARHCPTAAAEPTYKPPPRIPLLRRRRTRQAKKEVDRVAARSTEKKTAELKTVSTQSIRSGRQIRVHEATTFGFANWLCNKPLAFAGKWRTTRAADCPITADGLAPGVLEIQLLALLTGQALLAKKAARMALKRGKETVDCAGEWRDLCIRVPFSNRSEALGRLGRSITYGLNFKELDAAFHYLSAATVRLADGRELSRVVTFEHGPGDRICAWVALDWLDFNSDASRGVTMMKLDRLMRLKKPSHMNAFIGLSAWARTMRRPSDYQPDEVANGSGRGRRLVRPLDEFRTWFGVHPERVDRSLKSIRAAVDAAGEAAGLAYEVDTVTEGDTLKVRVYIPGQPERDFCDQVTDALAGRGRRYQRRSGAENIGPLGIG
jgi:hypothetical protein